MSIIGVYGTLKSKERANSLLSGSEFLGEFKLPIPFVLYHLGSYPALFKSNSINNITLELYDVKSAKTLNSLDNYEGYPNLYNKHTFIHDGMEITVYFMNRERPFGVAVDSGCWNSKDFFI